MSPGSVPAVFHADVTVVGAGIVGLSTARALAQIWPRRRIVVVDKECEVAAHQSRRNSGVVHSGIYYRPGSEKARLTAVGRTALLGFCAEQGVAYECCGKVVVATERAELSRLRCLHERAAANGVWAEMIGPAQLADLEPRARGVAALHVPGAGIVDYRGVCTTLARLLSAVGVEVRLGVTVQTLVETPSAVAVETDRETLTSQWAVNCAGLHADRLAGLAVAGGIQIGAGTRSVRIVPFRGEYFELVPSRRHLVRNLLYPVPDPAFPFLGAHFTRSIDGRVHAGPNAVVALAREGYRWRDVTMSQLGELASFPGFRRLARHHWRIGCGEVVRSLSKRAFVGALQRLVPEVRPDDLVRAPAGVRAQAVRSDGVLVDDFWFAGDGRVLHVLNAPSPGATAALAIGQTIASRLTERMT